ncbi:MULTISPECIES: TIGR00730 family Rossman fold protein [unclassified Yimella]|uniref:LOG family protein n=1 Tax=unclassified Yimella TaxID=2649892 RepID=UPI00101CCA0C|nr:MULTISPECIES: TIGR00730 family Rossman fold protein [unclassified Yimella]MCG8656634.1 TIGR00730 family Rossman fold protein [Yimella sp. NH-Cas1]RYG78622.1 TIGR00730 family Rossman fold protein [Yimella sp. RIT 621]
MTSPLRRIAVFCASRPGIDDSLMKAAYDAGNWLARNDIGLVYGGGGSGLMGAVSSGALDAGGEVIGVIPQSMIDREWGRHDLTRLDVVQTMHERKALMADHADAFLCLPGGLGTLEEIFEVWTWRTLGYHDKPVGFLDTGGFWQPMLEVLRAMVANDFVHEATLKDIVVEQTMDAAVAGLAERV